MNAIDERLEHSGNAIQTAFSQIPSPNPSTIQRRIHAKRIGATAAFSIVALLAGIAYVSTSTTNGSDIASATSGRDLPVYGLDLGAPWIAGEINHNDGAYDVDYWETYSYLPTSDGTASAAVVRVTTRRIDNDEEARRSVPALGARDATETNVAGRTVGAVVDPDGNYSYAWIDGNVLVDVVVIQMAPGAVTRELAETALGNVRMLTVSQRTAFAASQTSIPSGPETTLPDE